MAHHLHDVGYLISSNYATAFALRRNFTRKLVLLSFEDRSLMKADCRSMDAHITKHNRRVIEPVRETQMIRE